MSAPWIGARWTGITAVAVSAAIAVSAGAQSPPQPPPERPHTRAARTLPTPPREAIDQGLSLEHECLNAIGATRRSPQMVRPGLGDDAKRTAADEHLTQAEQEAYAGRGQACQDELGAASENLK